MSVTTKKMIDAAVKNADKNDLSPNPITEAELRKYMVDDAERKKHASLAQKLEKTVKALGADIMTRMVAGAEFESDKFVAVIDTSFQRTPEIDYKSMVWEQWKAQGIANPEAHEKALQANLKKNVYPKLVVTEKK